MKDPQVESIRGWVASVEELGGGTETPDPVAVARIKVLLDAHDRQALEREALGEKVLALHVEAYEALDACRKANDEAGQANCRTARAAEQVAAAARAVEQARHEADQVREILRGIIADADATGVRSSTGGEWFSVKRSLIDRGRLLLPPPTRGDG